MGLIDELAFEPDPELRRVLELYEQMRNGAGETGQTPEEGRRVAYHGRQPDNCLFRMRNFRKMTQPELAVMAGTTRRSISAIENRRREPSVYLALAIAEALGAKVEDIFQLAPATPQPPPVRY